VLIKSLSVDEAAARRKKEEEEKLKKKKIAKFSWADE